MFSRHPREAKVRKPQGHLGDRIYMEVSNPGRPRWTSGTVAAGVLLLILTLLFWNLRIFSGKNPAIEVGPVDLYISDTPMTEYGFAALKAGSLPLWNPYQFCGEPFLAVPYTVLFYPFHVVFLFVDSLTSVEILFVLHMFFGGLSMWALMRHFGIGALGGLCAAVTFMWSGYMILSNILPTVFETMTWMPVTVLMLDKILEGAKGAGLALILAVACQLLLGVPEVFIHTMYAGALFIVCRLAQLSWGGAWRAATQRGAVILCCIVAGVLLSAPQLLPTAELTQQSMRAAGKLTLAQVLYPGVIPAAIFLPAAIEATGAVTVGVLPLVAIALVIGFRRHRLLWIGGLIAAVGAALLVFGQPVYRYYYAVPLVGGTFRRPMKFLDIYAFGMALLVAVAVARLEDWADLKRRDLWTHPNWLAAVALSVGVTSWLAWLGKVHWYWAATVGGLLLFGSVSRPPLRRALVLGLCAVQAAGLFFTVGDTHVRPMKRPEIFHTHQALLDALKRNLGDARVYLSPKFWFTPGLTAKQGLLNKMAVAIDYEPLAVGRYARFFTTITPSADPAPFAGAYELKPDSRWRLMDLTGTKYFVMFRGEPGDMFMSQNQPEFRPVYDQGFVRVFEKQHVLPRAYFVAQARVLDSSAQVLEELDSPRFDPRAEVFLEAPATAAHVETPGLAASSEVKVVSYEPERVVIAVDAKVPGFLVLTDLFYPGWKAFVGDREVPIHRANYLFRAVRLDAASSEVRFEYRPGSFRLGLILAGCTAGVVGFVLTWTVWRAPTRKRGQEAA